VGVGGGTVVNSVIRGLFPAIVTLGPVVRKLVNGNLGLINI